MLEIQKFFRNGGSIDLLHEKYGIISRRSNKFPNLVLFKYDQISSPMGENIVQECRGIILDEEDNWNVISHAFDKFFNYGEPLAADIDWKNAKVYEKCDGSLTVLYFYRGEWHVATSGSPDASGMVRPASHQTISDITFAEYFWRAFHYSGQNMRGNLGENLKDFCFIFELTGPLNQIVVRHEYEAVTILGARNRVSNVEITAEEAALLLSNSGFNWHNDTTNKSGLNIVRSFEFSDIENIKKSFENISPLNQEGFIAMGPDFGRVKIKHPSYVAIHYALTDISPRSMLQVARTGEMPEIMVAFPALADSMTALNDKITNLVVKIEGVYDQYKHLSNQKEFAMAVKHLPYSGALFMLKSGKVKSVRQYLAESRLDLVMNLLDLDSVVNKVN